MSLDALLRDTFRVQRQEVSDTEDSWGQRAVSDGGTLREPLYVEHGTFVGYLARDIGKAILGPDLGGTVVAAGLLIARSDADVVEQDRVVAPDGREFEVTFVHRAMHPRTGLHHLELQLRRPDTGEAAEAS
jgi:hypothetical protein